MSDVHPKLLASWRTPALVIGFGSLIALIAFGPRSTLGFFLTPLSNANHWGRDVFAFALALQNLLWGVGQPLGGIIADRFGSVKVLCGGALLYALGLVLMAHATSAPMLDLSAGVLIGFGLAGCSFPVVLAALGKIVPLQWRSRAFGFGTAAGSFGQFLYSPVAVALMDTFGWQQTLVIFAVSMLAVLPLSLALATPPDAAPCGRIAVAAAGLGRSLRPSLLCAAWCSASSPAASSCNSSPCTCRPIWSTADCRRRSAAGPSPPSACSTSSARSPPAGSATACRSAICCRSIYFIRAAAILVFISFPVTPVTCLIFGATMGLMWLSTVPPTNGIIALMFGTRWLATLAGFAFFSHQVGGFLGVWLGGLVFDRTGSYNMVWWLAILFGVLSALINMPIVEKPVARVAAVPA